jgi:hypothetical protein
MSLELIITIVALVGFLILLPKKKKKTKIIKEIKEGFNEEDLKSLFLSVGACREVLTGRNKLKSTSFGDIEDKDVNGNAIPEVVVTVPAVIEIEEGFLIQNIENVSALQRAGKLFIDRFKVVVKTTDNFIFSTRGNINEIILKKVDEDTSMLERQNEILKNYGLFNATPLGQGQSILEYPKIKKYKDRIIIDGAEFSFTRENVTKCLKQLSVFLYQDEDVLGDVFVDRASYTVYKNVATAPMFEGSILDNIEQYDTEVIKVAKYLYEKDKEINWFFGNASSQVQVGNNNKMFLSCDKNPSIFLVGQSGSGKSSAIKSQLYYLKKAYGDEINLYISIGQRNNDLGDLSRISKFSSVANFSGDSEEERLSKLEQLLNFLEKRYHQKTELFIEWSQKTGKEISDVKQYLQVKDEFPNMPKIEHDVIFLDELSGMYESDLKQGVGLSLIIEKKLEQYRKASIFFCFAAQKVRNDTKIPRTIIEASKLIILRVEGGVKKYFEANMSHLDFGNVDITRLADGEMLVPLNSKCKSTGRTMARVRSPFVGDYLELLETLPLIKDQLDFSYSNFCFSLDELNYSNIDKNQLHNIIKNIFEKEECVVSKEYIVDQDLYSLVVTLNKTNYNICFLNEDEVVNHLNMVTLKDKMKSNNDNNKTVFFITKGKAMAGKKIKIENYLNIDGDNVLFFPEFDKEIRKTYSGVKAGENASFLKDLIIEKGRKLLKEEYSLLETYKEKCWTGSIAKDELSNILNLKDNRLKGAKFETLFYKFFSKYLGYGNNCITGTDLINKGYLDLKVSTSRGNEAGIDLLLVENREQLKKGSRVSLIQLKAYGANSTVVAEDISSLSTAKNLLENEGYIVDFTLIINTGRMNSAAKDLCKKLKIENWDLENIKEVLSKHI